MSRLEWSVHVVSKEHELGQSYTVLFFLGAVPESIEDWRSSDSLLGLHVSHTRTGDVPEEHDHQIESFIPLQRALKRKSGLPALTSDLVVPYLRNSLRWRVQKSDGDVVDNAKLTSLKVVIFSMSDEQKQKGEKTEYSL
ncbi:hypothetical protein EXIGLDRAFT_650015 [Exidia glandulosa HHB12029]|uniref:Tyrosinase C-terminal domain-containing protein n=1 Tax=Exidia glandulosa HHB12029 TaxID=1314781 RepID=A0A165FWR3_EXIGL|nr:hypothetical protein EXIGLDRAFT_650015 [Exidia glandulosa HHB12029]